MRVFVAIPIVLEYENGSRKERYLFFFNLALHHLTHCCKVCIRAYLFLDCIASWLIIIIYH